MPRRVVAHSANETGSGVYHVLLQDPDSGKKYNIKVRAGGPTAAVRAAVRELKKRGKA